MHKHDDHISSPIANPFKAIAKAAKGKLLTHYNAKATFFYTKKVNELIFNEDSLYTYLFKEFLVYEDYNEFFKRFYDIDEGMTKLNRITLFYSRYSKMFPNYIALPESKMLYRNIQKKQKMIDNLQEIRSEEEKQRRLILSPDYKPIRVLNTSVQKSILNDSNSFAVNLKDILNGGYGGNGNESESDERCDVVIHKLISTIEEMEKSNEEKRVIVKVLSLNKKSKIDKSELKKFHSLSPEQKQNTGVVLKNKKQNASNSTNATSFLSTLNNNTKEKTKALEKSAVKYSYFLSNCILKKSTSVNALTPVNKPDLTNSSVLFNSSVVNLANLSSTHAKNKKITFNQKTDNNLNHKPNMFSNRIPVTKPLNFSKINIQSIQTKLQNNLFDVEYLTHRSNQRSELGVYQGNAFSKLDLIQSRNSLLSNLSKSLQNIQRQAQAQGQAQRTTKMLQKNQYPYKALNKQQAPFIAQERKSEEKSPYASSKSKAASGKYVYQSKLIRGKYGTNVQRFISSN